MVAAIRASGFDPVKDQLVIGGDMINRGPDSIRVLMEARRLEIKYPNNIRVLMGNHEHALLLMLARKIKTQDFDNMGGDATAQSFIKMKMSISNWEKILNWISKQPFAWEDDEFVYTHSSLDLNLPLHEQQGASLWTEASIVRRQTREALMNYTGNRPIVKGHTPGRDVYQHANNTIWCDLGMGSWPNDKAGLAMVDLTNKRSYIARYNNNGGIETFVEPWKKIKKLDETMIRVPRGGAKE